LGDIGFQQAFIPGFVGQVTGQAGPHGRGPVKVIPGIILLFVTGIAEPLFFFF
jgi:hypothetical protein